MSEAGNVFLHDVPAGIVWRDVRGYHFQYSPAYRASGRPAISLTMPVREAPYSDPRALLPFFDNLIPEGWLLDVALDTWKLNPRDRMTLLLTLCRECIGAVRIDALPEDFSLPPHFDG